MKNANHSLAGPKIRGGVLECFFDGACEKNPGGSLGFGGAIFKDRQLIKECSDSKPADERNTNNLAEYCALILILKALLQLGVEDNKIHVFGDSEIVIEQMNRRRKIKGGLYVDKAKECLQLMSRFPNLTLSWIPRHQNKYADFLSKKYTEQ